MAKIIRVTLFWMILFFVPVCFGLQADINKDGRVDYKDLAIMAREWLMTDYYLNFDGTASITITDDDILDVNATDDYVFSFWIKTADDSANIMTRVSVAPNSGYGINIDSGSVEFYEVKDSSIYSITSAGAINDDDWHHVVCYIDRSTDKLGIYIDNSAEAEQDAYSGSFNVAADMYWGANLEGTASYTGYLDQIAMFKGENLAISTIVSNQYNSGIGVKLDGTESDILFGLNCDTSGTLTDICDNVTVSESNLAWSPGGTPFAEDIEHALVQRLQGDATVFGLVGERVYPNQLPQDATFPAVTYQLIGDSYYYKMGSSSEEGMVDARFQINSWADSYSGSLELAKAVRSALNGKGTVTEGDVTIYAMMLESSNDMPVIEADQSELNRYARVQDYKIVYRE